jgi:putative transposase
MTAYLPERKRLNHCIPPWVDERSFYFITICCSPRDQNHLCDKSKAEPVLNAAAFYHERLKWHCRLMLLMPDHVHGIIAFPRESGLKPLVSSWKHYISRSVGISWQPGFFDHRLRDRFQVDEKTSYVLLNPVRKGLCITPEQWPYVYRPMDRLL